MNRSQRLRNSAHDSRMLIQSSDCFSLSLYPRIWPSRCRSMNAVSAPICALLMRMAETDLVFHLPLNARNTARKRPTFLLWPVMEVCWKSADGPRDRLDDASIMRATTPANPALAASLTRKIARSQPLGFPPSDGFGGAQLRAWKRVIRRPRGKLRTCRFARSERID